MAAAVRCGCARVRAGRGGRARGAALTRHAWPSCRCSRAALSAAVHALRWRTRPAVGDQRLPHLQSAGGKERQRTASEDGIRAERLRIASEDSIRGQRQRTASEDRVRGRGQCGALESRHRYASKAACAGAGRCMTCLTPHKRKRGEVASVVVVDDAPSLSGGTVGCEGVGRGGGGGGGGSVWLAPLKTSHHHSFLT